MLHFSNDSISNHLWAKLDILYVFLFFNSIKDYIIIKMVTEMAEYHLACLPSAKIDSLSTWSLLLSQSCHELLAFLFLFRKIKVSIFNLLWPQFYLFCLLSGCGPFCIWFKIIRKLFKILFKLYMNLWFQYHINISTNSILSVK